MEASVTEPAASRDSVPTFTNAMYRLWQDGDSHVEIRSTGRRGGERVIGVVPKGVSHIFWQTVHAGAIKAAGEFGYTVDWNAPPLEIDASRHIELVDSMINRRGAGSVLAPGDKQALGAGRERASRNGMPVPSLQSGMR